MSPDRVVASSPPRPTPRASSIPTMPPLPFTGEAATSSPLSSPGSFVTATGSPPTNPHDVTLTDISTPEEVVASSSSGVASYRNARQLPPELRQHCQIYLEENLPMISISLLTSMLDSRRHDATSCPPVNQLSFLGTIIIHPDFTTRPKEPHWSEIGIEALAYLRSLLSQTGPVNARFDDAFRFGVNNSRWSRGASPTSDLGSEDDSEDGNQRSPTLLAGKYPRDSIWRRCQDFFSVVGWAFNCSVVYPNRWRHYKQWLEFMIDVLDADLKERLRLDKAQGQTEFSHLQRSILNNYLRQKSGRTNGGVKWILQALFADGGKQSSAKFQEIWVKEHKGISKNALQKRKRETVNIEKGDFGGYMDDDSVYSSQASEPPTPQKRRSKIGLGKGALNSADFQALEHAFVESIPLRQRLFSLISFLCFHLPSPPFDLADLYEDYGRTTRLLPLPIFSAFIDVTSSKLRVDSQISTLQDMLCLFMPSSALSPAKVDRECHDTGGISAPILERCFLPYSANTIAVEDNAKVSLLLENLLQLIIDDGREEFDLATLAAAVDKGIKARETKTKKRPTRGAAKNAAMNSGGADDPDEEARAVLDMSGQRLRVLVQLIEMGDDDDDDDEDEEGDSEMRDGMGDSTFMTAQED